MSVKVKLSGSHFLPALGREKLAYQFGEITSVLEFLGYNQGESSELLETTPSTLSRWKNSDKPVAIGKLRSKIVNDIDEIIPNWRPFIFPVRSLKFPFPNSQKIGTRDLTPIPPEIMERTGQTRPYA